MTASQLPLALAQRHYNRQLFADRFLDTTLPARPAWQELLPEGAAALTTIRALFDAFTPSTNEAQTEHDLVRPVLQALGHTFEIQAALRTPKGTKKPDYLFYTSAAARDANKNRVLTDADLKAAFAVGDAKYWERKLDVSSASETDEISRVPADQIAFYMRHSGVSWGILTNGRRWRLYHKDTVEKQDRFYEVDLKQLADANDADAFLYFYAFFRRAAFEPALSSTALTLEGMLRESADYARGVSESLKLQVFDALRHLAQGFLDYPRNQLAPDAETLREIYASSLTVLYRLLFILYAEARELLPLRASPGYREQYSLYALVRDAARRLDSGVTLLADTGQTWARLRDLFAIVDGGNRQLQVDVFNGGLFDPRRHPFLERYTVGDAQLQRALDKLARVNREFIDYRDLAERHLGTIYEGLLEFHLEPTAPTPDGFSVDLVNDRGERHRTGSYYTPDFVVQYIVETTLRPVLDAAVAGADTDEAKVAAVLAVNCCDLAMGSGHFPVAATEFIARYLLELNVAPAADAGDEPDLYYWKRRVAQSCIYGVDLNPLAVELAKLSLWLATAAKGRPLSFLDHHLRCGNALVGARASELDAPRAKKARASKQTAAATEAGQLSLLDDPAFAGAMATAVDQLWLIEGSSGRTLAEVKEQEQLYELVRQRLTERFALQADLATAAGFGAAPEQSLWRPLAEYATKRDGGAFAMPAYEALLTGLRERAVAGRYFHWDLEFPEVFYDRHGRPLGKQGGFDAIVGNPPYVRQEQLGPLKPYFQSAFPETYSGTADLFVPFFHQGVKLLREGGRMSYISSNAWLQTNYAGPLRRFMREQTTIESLVDLGNNRTFAEAPDVCPSIFVVSKAMPTDDHRFAAVEFARGEVPNLTEQHIEEKTILITQYDQPDTGWQLKPDAERSILRKLLAHGSALIDVIDGHMYYGVKTGYNEAFIIDRTTRERLIQADQSSAELIKQVLRGEDLRPWHQESEDRYLVFTRRGIDINQFPAIKEYLSSFRAQLEPKPRDWKSEESWPGRKSGSYLWYEIQDSVDYHQQFDKPKILWPEIGKIPRFSWDDRSQYVNNKGFFLTQVDYYILGILQSRITWSVISQICLHNKFRDGLWEYHTQPQFISRLPIPDAPEAEREAIGALALRITEAAKERYALHRRARRRIQGDLGTAGKGLNQRLTAWWELDFSTFREELRKVFKREIAVKERDDWEEWLAHQRERHATLTAAIVAGETKLNTRVYQLFDLSPDEIRLIEESTKYQYGEV